MAGLLYLPRLFVYHAERAAPGSELSETFKVMEKRLLRAIMNPAMIATWLFGLALAATPGVVAWGQDCWIYVKLAAVGVLTWFHHWLALRRKDFAADRNTRQRPALPADERGADAGAGRHRRHGGRAAVLSRDLGI